MLYHTRFRLFLSFLAFGGALTGGHLFGADGKILPGHMPSVVSQLSPISRVPATNQLRLAIGLPVRDTAGMDAFLARLYDPASPDYRHYLTPQEVAERFGPTEQDYAAVQEFARTNGLAVAATFDNRLVLDVIGPAAAIEKALHIHLNRYQHPTEARQFFAPDTEPTVAADLPVADIQGLSDFARPHPRLKHQDIAKVLSRNGSAPGGSGSYFGNDFRNAYAPGTTLTGAGQMVGLLQFDGFYSNDIAAYAAAAGGGRASIPIQTVLLDGYNGVPTTGANSGNPEVSLDIEMAMSMAPGLARIVVFEAGPSGNPNDILNSMLTFTNSVKQLSSSWGWSGGPNTTLDNIYKSMGAAGQSFFNASGDSDAFTSGASSANGVDNASLDNAPSSCPYITQVGGTTLSMNGTGASYASETVWNWGLSDPADYNGVGSSGGVSSYYAIPAWQTNVSNLAGRGGSASFRNIPDVALTADNVYLDYGNGQSTGGEGGTSCAAPLWAGFIALVNQQAAMEGKASVGFINPAIYALAAGPGYASCFHDIAAGNNTWSSSSSLFYATNGYDLCTGLGTPNGTNLINALAGIADNLGILAGNSGYSFSGPYGGPFSPASGTFVLTNASASALSWSLVNTSAWLTAASSGGALAAHGLTNVTIGLAASAGTLALGTYSSSILFSDLVSHVSLGFPMTLQVGQPLSVSPSKGFSAAGPVGGPFSSTAQQLVLTNLSGAAQSWSVSNPSTWLTVSPTNGTLGADGSVTITVGLGAAAALLSAGQYAVNLGVSDGLGQIAVVPFTLAVGQPVIQNGGFETGDFTDWIQSGNTQYTVITTTTTYVHSGACGAVLGPANSLGILTQNLITTPGQMYVLSFWLRNPTGRTPNQFTAQWNGTTVFSQSNITSTGWLNPQFFVTATGATTALQFSFEDTPAYLGLDDVTVAPLTGISFHSLVSTAGNFQLNWNTITGLVYQVQYKTNLLQPNWISLGAAATATSGALTVTDTNALRNSPQRYYRVMVVP